MRLFWLGLGWTCVGLGAIGVVMPLVPTTPFLLAAAWAFANSSERFHRWLLEHRHLGPPIHAWKRHRAIPRHVKWLAALSVVVSIAGALWAGVPAWALMLQVAILTVVMAFVLTRPSRGRAEPAR